MMAVCAIGFALASCVADEETLEPLNIGAPVARSHLAAMHSASVQCGALQSGRTCEALGWAVHHDTIAMECVCSLGIANEETAGRCRLASHQDAAHACHARHARQCSAFELEAGAASAISCRPTATRGGSHHAWSSTPCGDGKFFAVRPGAKMLEPDRATTCESASAERSVVCCADAAFPWAPAASATGAPFRELHPPRLQLPAPILEFHISEASERLGRPLFGVARFPPLPCSMEDCFDFSRCPSSRPFRVFVYPGVQLADRTSPFARMVEAVRNSPYATTDPAEACVFLSNVDINQLMPANTTLRSLLALFRDNAVIERFLNESSRVEDIGPRSMFAFYGLWQAHHNFSGHNCMGDNCK